MKYTNTLITKPLALSAAVLVGVSALAPAAQAAPPAHAKAHGYHRVAQTSDTADTGTKTNSKAQKGKGHDKSQKVGKNLKDKKSKGKGHYKKPSTPKPAPAPAPTASFADFLAQTSVPTLARFDGGDAGATGYDANSKNYYTGQQLCTTADFCRTAWASDMAFDDQGRLIVGWGDWDTNMDSFGTDRVGIIAQDPLTGEHLSERVPLGTEAFDVIRQFDGHLWIPTTDPSDKPGAGQRSGNIPGVWVNDGADGSWRLIQGPAGMIHVFDVAVVGDDVYLAGSTRDDGAVVYKGTRAGGDFELIRSSVAVSGLPYEERAWDRTYSIAADENGVYFFEDASGTRGVYAYDPDTGSVTRVTGPNGEFLGGYYELGSVGGKVYLTGVNQVHTINADGKTISEDLDGGAWTTTNSDTAIVADENGDAYMSRMAIDPEDPNAWYYTVVKIDPAGGPLQVYATIPYDQLHPDAQDQGGPRSLAVKDGKAWLSTNDGHVVVVDLLDTPVPYPDTPVSYPTYPTF